MSVCKKTVYQLLLSFNRLCIPMDIQLLIIKQYVCYYDYNFYEISKFREYDFIEFLVCNVHYHNYRILYIIWEIACKNKRGKLLKYCLINFWDKLNEKQMMNTPPYIEDAFVYARYNTELFLILYNNCKYMKVSWLMGILHVTNEPVIVETLLKNDQIRKLSSTLRLFIHYYYTKREDTIKLLPLFLQYDEFKNVAQQFDFTSDTENTKIKIK